MIVSLFVTYGIDSLFNKLLCVDSRCDLRTFSGLDKFSPKKTRNVPAKKLMSRPVKFSNSLKRGNIVKNVDT